MKLRFLLVGAWNTLFGFAVFTGLFKATRGIGLHYLAVMAIAQVIAVTSAYLTYKLFVFRTRGDILREYLRFWSSYAAIIGLQFVLMYVFVTGLHLAEIPAQALTTLVSVAVSWLLHTRFSFRRNE